MWGKFFGAFVAAAIGVTLLSIIEVDARSTVNGGESSESTLDEAVKNLIRQGLNNVEDLRVVNLIREAVSYTHLTLPTKRIV